MEPLPQVQPVPRKIRSTDSHGDLSLISLPRPSLGRIGAERCHGHPQRLAHPTGRALLPGNHVAKSSPALLQPLHVVGSSVRNQLEAELPDAIWQVHARGAGGEESASQRFCRVDDAPWLVFAVVDDRGRMRRGRLRNWRGRFWIAGLAVDVVPVLDDLGKRKHLFPAAFAYVFGAHEVRWPLA